jgi:hypothetical protein
MEIKPQEDLKIEWCLLQNQFDSYEKHSLYVKLSCVALVLASQVVSNPLVGCLVVLVLWLQDGIWKTFQSRIEARLLLIESAISNKDEMIPYQLNAQFQSSRQGALSLVAEYIKQAIRPTVAYPYPVLIALALI